MQTIFSLHNLEADNFFQLTTACEQFFHDKGNPPIKIMVRPLSKGMESYTRSDTCRILNPQDGRGGGGAGSMPPATGFYSFSQE